jgi:thiamine biosynthesis lipoprotein
VTDLRFRAMGTDMRVLAAGEATLAARAAQALIERLDAGLSRFRAGSELVRLNADPRPAVPATSTLRGVVRAAVRAAERTRGLVDPTLLGELERCGYAEDWDPRRTLALAEALALAPPRRPARPRFERAWSGIAIDDGDGTIHRRAGVRLDLGGIAKGYAADAAARLLRRRPWFVVDCGGDLAVGGAGPAGPVRVAVEHPLTGARAHVIELAAGGVATSGLGRRVWRGPDGRPRHHLLDPDRGEPAWTGVIAATAVGRSALEAEVLAKAALLSGPERGREVLGARGGVLVLDDGELDVVAGAHATELARAAA